MGRRCVSGRFAVPVDQPALSTDQCRRRAAPGRWGWRSWRHEVRAPHGRIVSIVPRLPRDERVRSKFLGLGFPLFDSLSPLSFSISSLFFFARQLFAPRETESRGVRARATSPLALLRCQFESRAACVLRFWRFKRQPGG